jgi:hypothetical protein
MFCTQLNFGYLVFLTKWPQHSLLEVGPELGAPDRSDVFSDERKRLNSENHLDECGEHVPLVLRSTLAARNTEWLARRSSVDHIGEPSPRSPIDPGDVSIVSAFDSPCRTVLSERGGCFLEHIPRSNVGEPRAFETQVQATAAAEKRQGA